MAPHTKHTQGRWQSCEKPPPIKGKPEPPPEPEPPPPGCGDTTCLPDFENGPDIVLVDWVGAAPPWGGVYTCLFMMCIPGGGRWQGFNAQASEMRAEWVTTGWNHWSCTSLTIPAGCTYAGEICEGGTCMDIMAPWPFVLTIP